jgi:1-phosphofructokinase
MPDGTRTVAAQDDTRPGDAVIACIAPNPALDRTLGVDRLVPGGVARTMWQREVAGGKGLNVARVIARLGGDPVVVGPLGGSTGRRIAELAEADGLHGRWTDARCDTRTCTVIVEGDGRSTVVIEPGGTLDDGEWAALLGQVRELACSAAAVTLSGSLPGDESARLPALVDAARSGGAPVWVDTSGAALAVAITVPGVAIKVNRSEAAAVVGDASASASAERLLHASRATAVVVTDGAAGAAYADHSVVWCCDAPSVAVVNATGSGDAALAGLVHALVAGAGPGEALRHAVATGAAAATESTACVDRATVAALLAETGRATQAERGAA